MKKIFLILVFVCSFFNVFAQPQNCPQIVFSYDPSGNRILRKLVVVLCNPNPNRMASEVHTDSTVSFPVSVYPNPAQNKINIGLAQDSSVSASKIELLDLNGKTVYSTVSSSLQIEVDVSSLSAGTYLLKITRGKKYASYNVLKN